MSAALRVDLDAIAANWRLLSRAHPSGPVAASLKADGYGVGARPVAARLYAEGLRHAMVATAAEAAELRDVLPGCVIGVLNGLPRDAEQATVAADAAPALGSLEAIARWQACATSAGRPLPVLLHVDTGLSRLGLPPEHVAVLAREQGRLDGLDVRFVMTHLASAETPDDPANAAQLVAFRALDTWLPGVPRSLANSSGVFLGPAFGSDLARAGAALFGINPRPGHPNPMRAAVRLEVEVLEVRDIAAGTAVGYNGAWVAARPSRIATAGIGYADGWHRARSNRGAAAFDGRTVPLVGRVSMDLTTFDATGTAIGAGDRLELIGPSRPIDEVAAEAGTNGYEVLTSLGRRIRRTCA